MLFNGVADPEQLEILTTALETYCRNAGIDPGTPAHEDAGRLVMSLFTSGAGSAEDLAAALEAAFRRPR